MLRTNRINVPLSVVCFVHLASFAMEIEEDNVKKTLFPLQGISLGCPLSPIMAALFLDVLDRRMEVIGLVYVRFMDDWVVLAPTGRCDLPSHLAHKAGVSALKISLLSPWQLRPNLWRRTGSQEN